MCPGINTDLDQIQDVRKTAIISEELNKLDVDIAALQETRLTETGSLREAKYTLFWCGKSRDKPRQHGVGLAVKNKLLGKIETPAAVFSRRNLLLQTNTIEKCHGGILAPVTGTNSITLLRGDMIYLKSTIPAPFIMQTTTPIIPLFAANSN